MCVFHSGTLNATTSGVRVLVLSIRSNEEVPTAHAVVGCRCISVVHTEDSEKDMCVCVSRWGGGWWGEVSFKLN